MASSTVIKKFDKVFSQFIRLRDSLDYDGTAFVCCSCGQLKPFAQGDAGHFINRRWMALRWREDNVHMQCRSCNRFDEGNAVGYARFMIKKYGDAHVDMLELLKHQGQKWTDFEVEILVKLYRQRIKNKDYQ